MSKEVFNSKSECCGCSACANICPRKAIIIEKDEFGFTYPKIDESKCINCKMCEKVCLYKNNNELNKPINCYAGLSIDDNTCLTSASGGIFYTIALGGLKKSFVVYGSYMKFKDSESVVEHIRIDNASELHKLQGSKYVQSDISDIFDKVKQDLLESKNVLFSGTPCQVQSLKNYLLIKKIDIKNLYTIDIICHGVPSLKLFNSYIDSLNEKDEIVDFKFRDKSEGWGHMASITLKNNNKYKKKRIYPKTSSYYHLFLNTDIYRESCYNCKFSSKNRTGDITIGDYWGIEKLHPEYLKKNGGKLDEIMGISCILVNSEKGKKLFQDNDSKIITEKSSIENISKYNHNLNEPSRKGKNRDIVLKLYRNNHSFYEINKWYKKNLGIKHYIYKIWIRLPYWFRKTIRNIINE